MARGPFQFTGSVNPGRSVFDLSHDVKTVCDMGQLIPILCDEMVPGDRFDIGNELVIRFQPLVSPVLHEINAYIHYFFVPYRLLWDDWEQFITGGSDGAFAGVLPRWQPTNTNIGSLWDYLGFPYSVDPQGAYPMDFPRRAYNLIYNEYYRDENLQSEVDLANELILNRSWEKDYFSSCLPWQQRGTAPALPISGSSKALWPDAQFGINDTSVTPLNVRTNVQNGMINVQGEPQLNNVKAFFAMNSVDLSTATTFNVADLRLAFQVQKWLERNARAGARYTEFLRAHYGVSPRDDRLQRPEYIGGSKSPVIVSEVLQTSASGVTGGSTPQGNMAGHGITVDKNYVAKYHSLEFGLVMGIMSVMPRTAYSQGINRQWLRTTKYDFYSPEFANLSEQAVLRAELYANNVSADNNTIFGYQGRYDEMRYKPNKYTAEMRTTYSYWHLGRVFGTAPLLNESFIKCVPDKRIFAVTNQPGLIVNCGNKIRAVRPLPAAAEPGLIDHNGG